MSREDGFLGEAVEFGGVVFELAYGLLELGCLGVFTDYFYHGAPGGDAQFGK